MRLARRNQLLASFCFSIKKVIVSDYVTETITSKFISNTIPYLTVSCVISFVALYILRYDS